MNVFHINRFIGSHAEKNRMSDTQSERRNSIKVDHSSDDIEFIIDDIGGSFGKFQLCNYVFYLIAIIMSGIFALSYVFAGLNLDYR